jgi:hypothetical protein
MATGWYMHACRLFQHKHLPLIENEPGLKDLLLKNILKVS